MASTKGYTDTDMGLNEIRKNLADLSGLRVKVGIPEGAVSQDGVPVAEYAAYNEFGVPGKKKKWAIPPRPFIRGWLADKESQIKATIDRLYKQVADGKMDARTAISKLGEFAQDGIKGYIRNGSFTPNSPVTIKRKKGKAQPLIDSGTMRNSVRYKVVEKGEKVDGAIG
jgi:hypothetical protein